MHDTFAKPQFFLKRPSTCLTPYVSHFWLSLNNQATEHIILPDGAVDIVIKIKGSNALTSVYGTTTQATAIALDQHCHYLGIRFAPGQSRHFLHASASDVTDRCESGQHLLQFSLKDIFDRTINASVFNRLDQVLLAHLSGVSPTRTRLDNAIAMIQHSNGQVSMELAADVFCRSLRQFERSFQTTVGVSPKFFSQIVRFQHAIAAAEQSTSTFSLSDLAVMAGYADQSHMTHAFQRMASQSPKQFLRKNVAFLQDSTNA